MERLHSLTEFSSLQSALRSKKQKLLTNCYLMPAEIEHYLQSGRIFFEQTDTEVLFLCEEPNYYQVYYYLLADSRPGYSKKGKPSIVNFVYRKDNRDSVSASEKLWQDVGFFPYTTAFRMALGLSEKSYAVSEEELSRAAMQGVHFQPASPELSPAILKLWDKALDSETQLLFSQEEVTSAVQSKNILTAVDQHGELIGAIGFSIQGASCELIHLAVREEARNMQIGNLLCRLFLHEAQLRGAKTCRVWVLSENTGAQSFYQRLGFTFDGKASDRLLLK